MEYFNYEGFPKEETYSLIDQIRRGLEVSILLYSRAYKKRQYPIHVK